MFDILPASDAHLHVRRRWLSTSLAVHALVVAIAVMFTRGALQATRGPTAKDPIHLFLPRPLEPAYQPARPSDVVAEPPADEFRTIPPLSDIVPAIPPIDLNQRPFDPRDFTGIGRESGEGNGVGSTEMVAGTFQANTVLEGFDPAVLLSQPTPRYPATLQSAGVAGSVMMEFVIDTTGKVERAALRVIESSHPAFEDAARGAVLGARFRPAYLNGRPVRQITRQRVRFVAND
jgi:TonB family protein